MTEYDLVRLRRARKIPPTVEVRVPGDELVPAPQPGECVVFTSHFARGFGLPASTFLRSFLDYYHLQLHHLGANAIMLLAAFATFCEGYLGVRPSIGLWVWFFISGLRWSTPARRSRTQRWGTRSQLGCQLK